MRIARISMLLFSFLVTGFLSSNLACRNGQSSGEGNDKSAKPTMAKDSGQGGKANGAAPREAHPLTETIDSAAIPSFVSKYPAYAPFRKDINKFYAARAYHYAWYNDQGLIPQAEVFYHRILNAASERPSATLPYTGELNKVFSNEGKAEGKPDPQTDLLLTASYFRYAKLIWGGVSENESRALNWYLPRKKLDLPALLDSLIDDKSASIIKHGYVYRQYDLLKAYLAKYQALENAKWPVIQAAAKKGYAKGDSSKAIGQMRQRLFLTGDLTDTSGGDRFDDALLNGLKHFQHRISGLAEDGVAGPGTIRELNVPVSARISQILVNMERARWVPAYIDRNYLIVNIPGFELYVLDKDSLLFMMNAVVGKAVHKTVIFSGNVQYVVLAPYWNVPSGIMRNEVLPGIRRDGSYLARHNMEWSGKTVRQRPGKGNPLGNVKFLFPNQYDIYLHDSPAKSLFNEDTRAFSHGCIRLADARKLALYLLRDDPNWPVSRIDAAMQAGKETWVTLKDPVPVFIAYFTAWVDRDGQLNWGNDIYKRDAPLARMLLAGGEKGGKKTAE